MNPLMTAAEAVEYAKHFIGTAYIYSGNGPLFDCSGIVCEVLRAARIIARDCNAQGLFNLMSAQEPIQAPSLGACVFFGPSPSLIEHVALAVGPELMLEAGGGDHSTTSVEAAQAASAFVRIRPITNRRDFFCAFMPKYLG